MALNKQFSITIDEAPGIIDSKTDLFKSAETTKHFLNLPHIVVLYNYQFLALKVFHFIPFKHLFNIVTKIVNSITAMPLQHRLSISL